MALMDNSPRHATVVAKDEVHCLTLDRAHFVKLLGPLKSILQAHSCLHVLRSIELFSELTDAELDSIVNAMHSEKFSRGAPIIREGKKGTTFYVIQTGSAEVSKDGVTIGQLQSGDYFGERSLIDGSPRSASVFATEDVVCYTLERKKFESLLINTAGTAGKFEEEMKRRQKITRSKNMGGTPIGIKAVMKLTSPPQ
jgi:CRP-like cAMP-binding protein|tara:strand:- start:2573 stop:3163 length:591 start_codon:yes stop_codon:yes gene_type:complete